MNVLFSIIPGHGHLYPCLPLARALQLAGHRVRFASASAFGDVIRAHGFEAVAAGLDFTQASAKGDATEISAIDDNVAKKMFVDGPPVMLAAMTELVSRQRPDVMLVDPWDHGAQIAAEAGSVPWGAVMFGVRPTGSFAGALPFDREERRSVIEEQGRVRRELRTSVGLEDPDLLEDERPFDRSLVLCMAPPSLESWPLRWISHTAHPLQPEIHRSDSDDRWLGDVPRDRPIVAVSFGTLFGTPDLETTVVEAAVAAGARVIVTSKHLSLADEFVRVVPWVSMENLLGVSDVLVHHGGWGSTIAAAASGTASITIPLGADQHRQSVRLCSSGAARSVDVREMNPDTLRAVIEAVVEDQIYTLNAQRLRREIEAMPTPSEVVPLVERLAETGGPVFNREPNEEI